MSCLAIVVLFVLVFLLSEILLRRPRATWIAFEYPQVLEGPQAVWVFSQVFRYESRTHPTASPPYVREPASQWCALLTTQGVLVRGRCPLSPSFHPNVSRIFRMPDGLYVFEFATCDRPFRLYRWCGERFEELPTGDTEEFVQRQRLSGLGGHDRESKLDALTEKAGWRRFDDVGSECEIVLKDKQIRILAEQTGNKARIVAKGQGWRSVLVEIDGDLDSRRRQ